MMLSNVEEFRLGWFAVRTTPPPSETTEEGQFRGAGQFNWSANSLFFPVRVLREFGLKGSGIIAISGC